MARYLFVDPGLDSLLRGKDEVVGGASVQAYNWMRGLKETGHEVSFLSSNQYSGRRLQEFTVIEGYTGRGGVALISKDLAFFVRVFRSYRPDYVYQGGAGVISFVLALLSRLEGITFIHRTANDADFNESKRLRHRLGTRILYPWALRLSGLVLCQNLYQLNQIKVIAPQKRCLLIGNPVWMEEGNGISERGVDAYIAWIGRFVFQKNMTLLLRVAEITPELQYRIAGCFPEGERLIDDRTRDAVIKLTQLPNVTFEGFVPRDQVNNFLKQASCLLCTSRFEGFPNTFLEAWSVGTPVVTTPEADPDGVVQQQRLGYSGSNIAELCEGLRSVRSDFSIHQRVRNHVTEHHDATVLAKKLTAFLDRT